jgi:uncharacterized protein (DUF2147 family)
MQRFGAKVPPIPGEAAMKRWCCLAALMLLSSSAYAGSGISFSIGGHRIHIESSRYCRSTSCASVSISGISDWRRKRDDDAYDSAAKAPVLAATAPSIVAAPTAAPAIPNPPAQPAAAALPPLRPAQPAALAPPLPPPLPPPAASPAEPIRPAPAIVPQTTRVAHEAEDEVADSPIGDWQTEGKGAVRIDKCGRALCGYVLNSSSDDKGEAVLVNMKPKTDMWWTGSVYSHDSGDTYHGTIEMKGSNTLRVEACALGRFYCSGNNWTRIKGRAERLVTSRQTTPEPRS